MKSLADINPKHGTLQSAGSPNINMPAAGMQRAQQVRTCSGRVIVADAQAPYCVISSPAV